MAVTCAQFALFDQAYIGEHSALVNGLCICPPGYSGDDLFMQANSCHVSTDIKNKLSLALLALSVLSAVCVVYVTAHVFRHKALKSFRRHHSAMLLTMCISLSLQGIASFMDLNEPLFQTLPPYAVLVLSEIILSVQLTGFWFLVGYFVIYVSTGCFSRCRVC